MMSRNLIQCRSEDVKKPKKFAYGVLHRHPTLTFFFEGGTSTWTSKQGGGDKKIFEDYLKQQKKSISIRFALQVMKSVQFRRRPIVVLPPIEYTCVCVCVHFCLREARKFDNWTSTFQYYVKQWRLRIWKNVTLFSLAIPRFTYVHAVHAVSAAGENLGEFYHFLINLPLRNSYQIHQRGHWYYLLWSQFRIYIGYLAFGVTWTKISVFAEIKGIHRVSWLILS